MWQVVLKKLHNAIMNHSSAQPIIWMASDDYNGWVLFRGFDALFHSHGTDVRYCFGELWGEGVQDCFHLRLDLIEPGQ